MACGTSYYAGLIGKYYLERLARIPVEVDYASEFRYRQPVVKPSHLVLAITQSGETVDTLAAIEEGQAHGAFTAAIVNVVGSQAARVCDGVDLYAGGAGDRRCQYKGVYGVGDGFTVAGDLYWAVAWHVSARRSGRSWPRHC